MTDDIFELAHMQQQRAQDCDPVYTVLRWGWTV